LIATIATAPQQTVHAQVVEDLHQAGQMLQTAPQTNAPGQPQTIVTADSKDLIQQYLPARKRKPRVKKLPSAAPKIAKVEGMDSIIATTTPTTTQVSNAAGQQAPQQQAIENGSDGQLMGSTPHIKSEMSKVENIVNVDPSMIPVTSSNTSGEMISTTPVKGKRSKNPSNPDSKCFSLKVD